MGVTVKTPPAPPAPPPAPDQSSVAIQQFGALFRRKAAAASGYEGTFKAGPSGVGPSTSPTGSPVPFRTDTEPVSPPPPPTTIPGALGSVVNRLAQPPAQPTPTSWRQTTPSAQTKIVIDPVTGMPTEVSAGAPIPASPMPQPLRRKLSDLNPDSTLLG